MSEVKPTPLFVNKPARICPVCKKTSYSRDGIHPQCAAARADEPRRLRLAAAKKAQAEINKAQEDS